MRFVRQLQAVLVALACGACSKAVPCIDLDLDGYGDDCDLGPDCDDRNAARNVDCVGVPEPDCDENGVQPGCPCYTHQDQACYLGPDGTDEEGLCAPGVARCTEGTWGLCEGQTLPIEERCDGEDQDCDGRVDDGVESPCGGCNPGCVGTVVGSGGDPFDATPGASFDGVEVGPDGALVLASLETATTSLWVANSGEDTVSRLDTRTGEEIARHPSGGSDPSRTAVDYRGDAYVANRAFERQATVAKIAADESRCVDRDLDGRIDTSHGPDEVLSKDEDECVVFVADVGEPGAVARALAVDGDLGLDGISGGNPWVGLHFEERVVRLDPLTGEVDREVATPGLRPYGAAVGPEDVLWVAGIDSGRIASIDTRDPRSSAVLVPIGLTCDLAYGIAVGRDGSVWLGGWSCGDVRRYDPAADRWDWFRAAESVRGVTIDDEGFVWASHTGGFLSKIDPVAGLVDAVALDDGRLRGIDTVGVAIDADGRVWAVSRQGGGGDLGLASRVDPGDGSVTSFVVGLDPYTYSDMTGHALRSVMLEDGTFSQIFTGCAEPGSRWDALHFEGLYPPGTTIELAVRRADDEGQLPDALFATVAIAPDDDSPVELDLADGGVVEVRATLRSSDQQATPRLTRLALQWTCPGPE